MSHTSTTCPDSTGHVSGFFLTVCQHVLDVLQRVLLLSYDKTSKRIHLRHFSISAQPSGVSKSVKALVSQRAVPDMGNVQDVSEFLCKSGYGSVSCLGMSCCYLSSSVSEGGPRAGRGRGRGAHRGGGAFVDGELLPGTWDLDSSSSGFTHAATAVLSCLICQWMQRDNTSKHFLHS